LLAVSLIAPLAIILPASAAVPDPYAETNVIGGQKLVLNNFSKFPRWVRVLPQLDLTTAQVTPQLRPWIRWAEGLRTLPATERLAAIHSRVNTRITYRTDMQLWGQRDYWEIPAETALRGSTDCEGYAIFKKYLAIVADVPAENLFVLVGTITQTREAHAVLIADADGAQHAGLVYVLDNRNPQIVDIETSRNLTALYSLDLEKALLYLNRR
jgi:predicted transglutaminase-like cysteine proteinase